jgi:hypothetical protein
VVVAYILLDQVPIQRISCNGQNNKKPRINIDDKTHANYIQPGIDNRFATFKRIHPATLHAIFMHFVTPDLLSKIIDNMSDDHFILNRQRNYVYRPSSAEIYISLAIVIRIQGLHIVPQESMYQK